MLSLAVALHFGARSSRVFTTSFPFLLFGVKRWTRVKETCQHDFACSKWVSLHLAPS